MHKVLKSLKRTCLFFMHAILRLRSKGGTDAGYGEKANDKIYQVEC